MNNQIKSVNGVFSLSEPIIHERRNIDPNDPNTFYKLYIDIYIDPLNSEIQRIKDIANIAIKNASTKNPDEWVDLETAKQYEIDETVVLISYGYYSINHGLIGSNDIAIIFETDNNGEVLVDKIFNYEQTAEKGMIGGRYVYEFTEGLNANMKVSELKKITASKKCNMVVKSRNNSIAYELNNEDKSKIEYLINISCDSTFIGDENATVEVKNNVTDDCYVYLMVDNHTGYHKIGISKNPSYREKTLQSEKPVIDIVYTKRYVSRKMAMSIESALHKTYNDKRVRGEWFSLQKVDIDEIGSLLSV